ncbi:hypothetical protein ACW9KT_19445 [Hymenobacter sp. HD11105]
MELNVDLLCHPSMKPFERSFKNDNQHQSPRVALPANAWFYDKPSLFDKALNFTAQLTKFRQSDFTSSRAERVRIVVASLYPPPAADDLEWPCGRPEYMAKGARQS